MISEQIMGFSNWFTLNCPLGWLSLSVSIYYARCTFFRCKFFPIILKAKIKVKTLARDVEEGKRMDP